MKRIWMVLLAIALCVLYLHYLSPLRDGTVVAVHDGDTISVLHGGTAVRVRVACVDCPEWDQPFGREATAFTRRAAYRKIVRIKGNTTDDYGRLVARVFLPDGRSLGSALLEAGLAWWDRLCSDARDLKELEADARTARRGLWRDPDAIPPWKWRKTHPK
jgi:micrococcal nuclease